MYVAFVFGVELEYTKAQFPMLYEKEPLNSKICGACDDVESDVKMLFAKESILQLVLHTIWVFPFAVNFELVIDSIPFIPVHVTSGLADVVKLLEIEQLSIYILNISIPTRTDKHVSVEYK